MNGLTYLSDRLFDGVAPGLVQYGPGQLIKTEVTTEPKVTVVSVAEATDHLRAKNAVADQTTYLTRVITAATKEAEKFCNRAFIYQTVKATFALPATEVKLPRAPFRQLVSSNPIVRIYEGSPTVLTSSSYYVTPGEPARLRIKGGASLDTTAGGFLTVEYECGWGDGAETAVGSDVPEDIRQAVLIAVAEMFENRTESVTGTVVAKLPRDARRLLEFYRVRSY